ncbi:MAG TPA: flavin reductase family protein [Alphaproteobacteria bacterium]|nr:flavin reductase family protein [Alphaproteobacteria bacterium]
MALTKEEYRRLIGCFATGVTVITAARGEEVRGMTANAVTSLSLEPLLLLVCVDKRTITHQFLEEAQHFAVNILAEDQEQVSRALASRDSEDARRLIGYRYRPGQTGAPILEDCLAYVECRITEVISGGDHSIFIGQVESGEIMRDVPPLLFFRGKYSRLTS